MYLFEKGETTASFRATSDVLKRNIDGLSNEEICGTDLDELEEYYLSKKQIYNSTFPPAKLVRVLDFPSKIIS